MATTYGYGGEFSSDEDIDRMEHQTTERLQSKFDSFAHPKPSKHQIEEAITSIRQLPIDQDVDIADDLIAGLLDYYKTQRGPIVQSTRNLYKKIILKLIREGHSQATNGDATAAVVSVNDSNGNNNNVVINSKQREVPVHSSDEDEPMPSASQSSVKSKNKFDSRVVYDSDNLEPMEVDSEELTPQQRLAIRNKKQVETSESETEESTDESDSEVVDVTPIKGSTQVVPKAATVTPAAAQKALEAVVAKKSVVVKSKDSTTEASKKRPQTRSQRQAASKSSSNKDEKKIDSSSKEASTSANTKLSKSSLTSYEQFSRCLRKIKIDDPVRLNLMENENKEIVFEGTTINGRKLNYAEKMVLTAMFKHKQPTLKNRQSSDSNRVSGTKPF